jgi:broad specificity phosphatase PhoE
MILYLVRHGQAGTREQYDSLSDLGREQARLLGEHFRAQGIRFDAVYSGSLKRQRATAEATLGHVDAAGALNVIIDPGWNEFDLAQVYSEYAPHLSAADADFRREYGEMQAAIEASRGAADHAVHRKWNDCDKKVVRAWVESRYEYSGETWPSFVARIHAALDRVTANFVGGPGADLNNGTAIVFTSATPIGVCAARTLELEDGRAMWLAGVLMNASFSTLRVRGSELRLFSLNNAPHLNDAPLRTFR